MVQSDRSRLRGRLRLSVVAGLLTGLLALLLGAAVLALRPATWTAELPLLVQPAPRADPDLRASYYEILIGGQVTATYAELLGDERGLTDALSRAGLPASPSAVAAVTVTAVPGTTLLQVTASGPTAEQASRTADAVAQDAVVRIRSLQDPFTIEIPGPAAGSARQSGQGLAGLAVVALTAAGAAGLAVQQLVYRLGAARDEAGPQGSGRPSSAGGHDQPDGAAATGQGTRPAPP